MTKKRSVRKDHPKIDLNTLGPVDDQWMDRYRWFDRIQSAIQSLMNGDEYAEGPDWVWSPKHGCPVVINVYGEYEGMFGVIPRLATIISGIKEHPLLFPPFENDLKLLIQRFRERGLVGRSGELYLCRDGIPDERAMVLQLISLVEHNQATKRGESVLKGSRKPRKDNLAILSEKTIEALRKKTGKIPSTKEVLHHLESYDSPKESFKRVIDEIDFDSKEIIWTDRRGRDRRTTFKRFGDRVNTIRKHLSK